MQIQSENLIYRPKKELLSCRLCTDIYKKPITLTCGHTFCYFCLYKYMKQNSTHEKVNPYVEQNLVQKEQNKQQKSENIPLPLCPTCNSLILRPIRKFKENLTLSNLITLSQYKPELTFDSNLYEDNNEDLNLKILLKIQNPSIQPLPFCSSEIRFSTCFLDDILQQSHTSYIVIQWSKFNKNIGLAGKILRTQIEYHSSFSSSKQSQYRAYFTGLFFVTIKKRKPLQINLKSRFYTQTPFCLDQQELAKLDICQCEQFNSQNILTMQAFQTFLSFYDTLNNPHYLNQIYKIVDPKPFFQRNNPEAMIYCCIRVLKFTPEERKTIIQTFDDSLRIQKINQYLEKMKHLPIEEFMHISIPGKYNSAFVFGVIFVLILLHYIQSG